MQRISAFLLTTLTAVTAQAMTIINDQPIGELVSYNFTGYSTTVNDGDVQAVRIADGRAITDVVYAPDGHTVYMRNLLPTVYSQAWIAGEQTDDGSQLTFPLGQALAASNFGTEFLVTSWIEGNVQDDVLSIALHPEVAQITFTRDADGTLTLQGSGGDAEMHDVQGIAIVQQSNNAFYGYMSYGISLIPSNQVPLVAPSDLVTDTYTIESGLEGRRHTHLCRVAIEGNTVWLGDLVSKDYGERWARGTLQPGTNRITIPSGQFLGTWRGHSFYWQGVQSEKYDDPYWGYVTRYLPAPEMVLDYDPVSRRITSDMTLLFTTDTADVFAYVDHLDKPILKPYLEQSVTPAAPAGLLYDDSSFEKFGAFLSFDIPNRDVEGEYIDPANLSYRLFVDNDPEPFVFRTDEYPMLPADLTEIPYGFSDGSDFFESTLLLHERGFSRIGLQSVCRIGEEVSYSEITWHEFSYAQPDYRDPDFSQYAPAEGSGGDGQVLYGNYRGEAGSIGTIGFDVCQDYDIAMRINDPNLIGCSVTALRIPVQLPAHGINYRAWLSHDLNVNENQMLPDICSVLFDPEHQWTEVQLAEPFVIDAPFFAGFSFSVPEAKDSYSRKPLVVANGADDNGVWIRSSRTYRRFEDFTHRYSRDCSCPMVLVLAGDLRQHAAAISAITAEAVMCDEPVQVMATLRNHGSQPVESLDIDYLVDGLSGSLHLDLGDLSLAATYYNEYCVVPLQLPGISHNGAIGLQLTVSKVNDQPNQDVRPVSKAELTVLGKRPIHRPVLEEYTGTWCGWCPRGFVGLQRMNQLYPEDFIGISYHNNDPMEIMGTAEYPSSILSFPAAYMDRSESTDAYGGDNQDRPFGVDQVWLRHRDELAIASVDATAQFSVDDDSLILVESSFEFIRNIDQANYAVGYVLTADQLTDPAWAQCNYYSNLHEYDDDPAMSIFVDGRSYIAGLKFDDVAIMARDVKGIEGSLPSQLQVNQTYTHQYTFDLRQALSTEGDNLVQDRGRLHVVVLLIDRNTQGIVNAIKVQPPHRLEAIETLPLAPDASPCYNLMGQPIRSQRGLVVSRRGVEFRY